MAAWVSRGSPGRGRSAVRGGGGPVVGCAGVAAGNGRTWPGAGMEQPCAGTAAAVSARGMHSRGRRWGWGDEKNKKICVTHRGFAIEDTAAAEKYDLGDLNFWRDLRNMCLEDGI